MGRHDVAVHLLIPGAPQSSEQQGTGSWRNVARTGVLSSLDTPRRWTAAALAGERLAAVCDDPRLLADFRAVFGGDEPVSGDPPADATVTLRVTLNTSVDGFGYAVIEREGHLVDVDSYLIGVERADSPYRVADEGEGWRALLDRSSGEPVVLYRGADILFRISEVWTIVVLTLVFRAVFGTRDDAILFHAGSVAIGDHGVMLAGPARSGKSTLSLALAARGHQFLGDEIAWYLPATHELVDFRRPVGIREGLRARAVDEALEAMGSPSPHWHDSVRLPIDSVIRQEPPRTVTLRSIFLLRGFGDTPRAEEVKPTLDHLPLLQPIGVSLMNIPAGRRLLQMTKLISSVRMYDLTLGHPDETAQLLEEVAHSHAHDSQ